MSGSSRQIWLLVGFGLAVLVVSRLSRAIGPAGIILTIALVLVFVWLARDLVLVRSRPGEGSRWRAPTRNVTPPEPRLDGPAAVDDDTSTISSGARPPVIVVEPEAQPLDDLEQRLLALDRLRANGLVTEAEYEAKRARLIADF